MKHVLTRHLPESLKTLQWRLLYCVGRDGYSHHTMFRNTANQDYTLLFLKDSLGHIFGAYISGNIKNRTRYTGDSDSFVFTFHDGEELELFQSTGEN